MATRTPLMAGNWKMNLDHLEATHLVQKLAWLLRDAGHDHTAVEVAVLPAATSLRSVQTLVEADDLPVRTGGQDLSAHDSGAYTGEVSGAMLARLGCTYACVGHSERREHHGEDDATVAAKAQAAHRHGLVPIVCVGEPLEVREAGDHVSYTLAQLDGSLAGLSADQVAATVVAYEPVWAIGTGRTCDADDAQEVCAAIRARLAATHGDDVAGRVRVLYGGSVKPSNVAGIMAQADIDGALVGGASLKAEDFAGIVRFREHPTA
ncbi:triose-phosphate isomerase [Aquipuribacter nitratireducens]|uniref:Triosephosphate isomerase n=1 Tax=Aquipuribacter nitratireducens TaxID=650104 RepID=A0ABW0GIJ9_9MICO